MRLCSDEIDVDPTKTSDGREKRVEAPGIEPGSENFNTTRLRTYPAVCIAPDRACRRALLGASHLFDLALHPVARCSAIQLGHALG